MRRAAVLLVACALSGSHAAAAEAGVQPDSQASSLRDVTAGGPGVLVRRGGWAVLSTSQGGVAVESRVEVLQDGRAGQRVLVRGSAWPQPVAARVLGDGRLEPAR